MFVDTHSHIYSEEFSSDRDDVIARGLFSGVNKIILPNIDSSTIKPLLDLAGSKPEARTTAAVYFSGLPQLMALLLTGECVKVKRPHVVSC